MTNRELIKILQDSLLVAGEVEVDIDYNQYVNGDKVKDCIYDENSVTIYNY